MPLRSVLVQEKEEVIAENGMVVAESVGAAEAAREIAPLVVELARESQ